MIRFECDYGEGAHPRVLEALSRTNLEQMEGYGLDEHCEHARELIRRECACPDAVVEFLVGGTQTNATVIDAVLRPYQGVLSPDTGHIACHEAGAVEAAGHKVLVLPGEAGKLTADQIRAVWKAHWNDDSHEHTVMPGMVYISQPTEYGTLYSPEELREIYSVCQETGLPLFIDGARLGYGLAAGGMTLAGIASCCDVFTIGGTKVGLLLGEAVVFPNPALGDHFRYMMKRHGAVLAKGRLLGVQFETVFEDGLYYKISAHAVEAARRVKAAFAQKGVPFLFDSPTNQQFVILTKEQQRTLGEKYAFKHWQAVDKERDAVRFATSWATTEEAVESLVNDIKKL